MLPKAMHPEFGAFVQEKSDELGVELTANQIFDIFKEHYLDINKPYELKGYEIQSIEDVQEGKNMVSIKAKVAINGKEKEITGEGNGPLNAFYNGLISDEDVDCKFKNYSEHALEGGSCSRAVCYIQIESKGKEWFGVGISENIATASLNALISAMNRCGNIRK